MNLNDLAAGTRPSLGNKIIMTGSDGFDGYEIIEYCSMVWGMSVRAKDMGQDCAMSCQTIAGGELTSYSDLGSESRNRAIDKMLKMAKKQGANAIINVNWEVSGMGNGISEITVNGTSVKIVPIKNYVPSGVIGNVLVEINKNIKEK